MVVKHEGLEFLELQAEVLRAVAHPFRLAIVRTLADGELCVGDIVDRVGGRRSNLSRHLAVMTRAGILAVRRDGVRIMYRLAAPCIVPFLSCIKDVVASRIEEQAAAIPKARPSTKGGNCQDD